MNHSIHKRARLARLLALLAAMPIAACESPTSPNETLGPGISVSDRERITAAHTEAKRAARAGEPEKAEYHYRRAVAFYAEYAPAWNNLGVTLMDQERFLEAAEAFQRAADLAPADPRPVYNHGLLFSRRAYPREALPLFLAALERDPHFLPALRAAIRTEVRLRDVSEQTLARIRSALLLETDPAWQRFFELQRLRIEADLSTQSGRRSGSTS